MVIFSDLHFKKKKLKRKKKKKTKKRYETHTLGFRKIWPFPPRPSFRKGFLQYFSVFTHNNNFKYLQLKANLKTWIRNWCNHAKGTVSFKCNAKQTFKIYKHLLHTMKFCSVLVPAFTHVQKCSTLINLKICISMAIFGKMNFHDMYSITMEWKKLFTEL